jgi:hypothetical protein
MQRTIRQQASGNKIPEEEDYDPVAEALDEWEEQRLLTGRL